MVTQEQGLDTPASCPPGVEEELKAYHFSHFDAGALPDEIRFPLPDEPFVPFWEELVEASCTEGAFAALHARLPQLAFPIQAGISTSEPYLAATRRGVAVGQLPQATGLGIAHPEAIEVSLHRSPAGAIPLLVARRREEFEALVRALTRRNEPAPIPAAQGALMVAGYNNWCRLAALRSRWEALPEGERKTSTWSEELRRIQNGHKEWYQDRFILLSDGPYSAVPAAALGLSESEWRAMSLVIRRDHECAHYLTRRLFGTMRNHLLDELLADYAGLVGATGRYRADWFLRFLGLEDFPHRRIGGRIEVYRGEPPLSEPALARLQQQVRTAALVLERFDRRRREERGHPAGTIDTARVVIALATLRLDQLAAPDGEERLAEAFEAVLARSLPAER